MDEPPEHTPSPHGEAIGLKIVEQTEGRALVTVPYSLALVGDPESGVIHGGVLTTMLDNASGMAVRCALEHNPDTAIATLDLRIDYLRGARPNAALFAESICYKRTRNVAFVRGIAYEDVPEDPIATSVATFVLGTRNSRRTS